MKSKFTKIGDIYFYNNGTGKKMVIRSKYNKENELREREVKLSGYYNIDKCHIGKAIRSVNWVSKNNIPRKKFELDGFDEFYFHSRYNVAKIAVIRDDILHMIKFKKLDIKPDEGKICFTMQYMGENIGCLQMYEELPNFIYYENDYIILLFDGLNLQNSTGLEIVIN